MEIKRKNIYSNKKWIHFSNKMKLELGNACLKCGRSSPVVVLQIHHIVYEKGKLPWLSLKEDLELLCKGCHSREHGILEPSDSWILIDITDNGIPSYKCERQKSINTNCNTEIRYEHTIYHPDVGYRVVGSTCINHLTRKDQKISKDSILEKNNYYKKLMRLEKDYELPRGWKIKDISKRDRSKVRMTTFDIEKYTNNCGYKINAVIYHNENNINNMTIEIDDYPYYFVNKKNNKRSQYMYNEKFQLRKVICIIDGIKRTEVQGSEHLEAFYRQELKDTLNSLNYKMVD